MNDEDFLSDLRAELKRPSFFPLVLRLSFIALRRRKTSFPPGFFVSGRLFGFARRNACLRLWQRLRNRKTELVEADFFSGDFYLACNRDVEVAGWNPWLHYQLFGRAEGRSPHPLVNPRFLASELEVGLADAVDVYLSESDYWHVSPSEYVDVWGFLRAGKSDGIRHPFVQMLEDGFATEPWVSQRLQIINLSLAGANAFELQALAVISSLNGAKALWQEIRVIRRRDVSNAEELSQKCLQCIPGFGLFGESGTYFPHGPSLISSDQSTVAGPDQVIFLAAEGKLVSSTLIYMTGNLSVETLEVILPNLKSNSAVAPSSLEQEQALRYLKSQMKFDIQILAFGVKAAISPTEIIEVEGENRVSNREWDNVRVESVDFQKVSILLGRNESERSLINPKITELLVRGAHLCIVDGETIAPWLPTLWQSEAIFFGEETSRWISIARLTTQCAPLVGVSDILI